jgi:hypothetical protein
MGAFQARIALPLRVRRELERSQIFLSLDPQANGILRIAIVPEEMRAVTPEMINQPGGPEVYWLNAPPVPKINDLKSAVSQVIDDVLKPMASDIQKTNKTANPPPGTP